MPKITNWICKAKLAGISNLKIGWAGRGKDEDTSEYLAIDNKTVLSLSKELNYLFRKSFAFLKEFIEKLHKFEDGNYVVIKPAFAAKFKLFRLPESTDF